MTRPLLRDVGTHLVEGGVVCLRVPTLYADGSAIETRTDIELASDGRDQVVIFTARVHGLDPDQVRAALVQIALGSIAASLELGETHSGLELLPVTH